ncbi:MAG TPA: SET domain-containing protein [Ignavibacteriaceae bacterium]|nr:SET domain-containing protein [Ignavibacteriaceae bacterium]
MSKYENYVEVRESEIHGKGIFASVDIPANAHILVIQGEIISEEECIRRENEEENVYIFWNELNYIDVANTQKIKYINHNCDCNCEVWDRDEESLWLVSSRDIKAGEELTIDYGYEDIYANCGCEYCRIETDAIPEESGV